MRRHLIGGLLAAITAGIAAPAAGQDGGLATAISRFPPLILGPTMLLASGAGPFAPSCPDAGSRVEQRGGPAIQYGGTDPASADLCRMRFDGKPVEAWFGIWLTSWPGAEQARTALRHLIQGRTGDTEGFIVRMSAEQSYYDILRNEGIEDLRLLGRVYRAVKISHYREGVAPNTYRSLVTGWKDLNSGMMIYVTYQHISGAPEIYTPLDPTAIVPAR